MPQTKTLIDIGSKERRHRASTLLLLRLAMAAALLVPAALLVIGSWISYRNTQALADERIERSIEVVEEQALKVLESVNLAFVAVNDLLDGRSEAEIRANEADFENRLKATAAALPEVESISVFDANGRTELTTEHLAGAGSREVTQEEFFRVPAIGFVDTYMGRLHDAQGNRAFWPLSRARRVGGVFKGVIEISVLPSDFGRFYSRIVNGPGLQYAMFRGDGELLVRFPEPIKREFRLSESSGFKRTLAANPQGGFYTVDSQIDGIRRRFGVRQLPGYPLYMTAGIETSAITWEWLSGMAPHLLFGVPATFLLFLSLAIVLRRTQRLYAEQDLREAAEDTIRQAQKMDAVGRLTGGIAHDFNNLLMIIIGNLEIVQRQLDRGGEAARAKLVRSAESAMLGARRAAELTQRLLAFSRQAPLSPRTLDANRLVAGLADFLARTLGEVISLEVVGGAGLWTTEVDQPQLEAAILNLAVNARDAMPDGGKLTIETSNVYLDEAYCRNETDVRAGQYVLIAVSDTGAGMSKEVIERAFEPFFTTKPAGQGTGLGLSQVYGFVKQSGGHLKIYSEPGEGTSVKLYLPRAVDTAKSTGAADVSIAPEITGASEHVLVVEDDEQVRAYVVETLRGLNYQVDEAPSGDAAIQVAADRTFDLLLTDVVLPGINGRQLAEALKTQQPSIKVLFMTGYSRNAIVHNGRLDPGVAMIQKPVTGRELAAKIRNILDAAEAPVS